MLMAALAVVVGCPSALPAQETATSIAGPAVASLPTGLVDSTQIAIALAAALAGARPAGLHADEWSMVARLYGRVGTSGIPTPRWLDGDRLAPRAHGLARFLASVDTIGLRSSDYSTQDVAQALAATASSVAGGPGDSGATVLARADVRLTASFVALVHDLLIGRTDPRKSAPGWHIARGAFDVGARVEASLDAVRSGAAIGTVLAGLRPDYGSYRELVRGLARYRELEQRGDWPVVSAGPTLRLGDTGPRVDAVRRRLAAEGYLPASASGDTIDATTVGAVAEFQRRHGLLVDGLVGPGTRAALNIAVSRRVQQIEANIERLRWLPPDPGERFVVVNVPAFVLYAYDGGKRVLTMRVVVGEELVSRRTPIFADTMRYIEFGPYWNVPRSIAVNEILPRARRDRGYLARNQYKILRGWGDNAPAVDPYSLSNAALFSTRYRVRQDPGPRNAMGRVKFMFPNDYAVYLHDTPAQARFAQAHRAHSHGCVRVADPEALADYVLQHRTDWPRDRIATTLNAGRRVRVNLSNGPAVYLVYLTAFAHEGEVTFRDDIYDRDDAILRALARPTRRP